jgi:AraC-like DNA-binding protein
MFPTDDVAQMIAAPVGRYLVLSSCVLWVQCETRLGVIHTAPRLAPADIPALARCIGIATHDTLAPRYEVSLDMSAVQGVDVAAFEFITQWLERYFAFFEQRIQRIAGIAPDGVAGAALGGLFYKWAVPRFDSRLCSTRAELYAALEMTATDAAELEALYATHGPGPLRHVRDVLAAHVDENASQLATRLGMTERSLRRLLAGHQTSLRAEIQAARMRTATMRLAATQMPETAIAKALGYRSKDAFRAAFETSFGVTPSAYRSAATG